jgi:hypothetical protein
MQLEYKMEPEPERERLLQEPSSSSHQRPTTSNTMAASTAKDESKNPVQDVTVDSDDNGYGGEQVTDAIDPAYPSASQFTKFYRGVLFQMILFGA